jgi:hypothetical protein
MGYLKGFVQHMCRHHTDSNIFANQMGAPEQLEKDPPEHSMMKAVRNIIDAAASYVPDLLENLSVFNSENSYDRQVDSDNESMELAGSRHEQQCVLKLNVTRDTSTVHQMLGSFVVPARRIPSPRIERDFTVLPPVLLLEFCSRQVCRQLRSLILRLACNNVLCLQGWHGAGGNSTSAASPIIRKCASERHIHMYCDRLLHTANACMDLRQSRRALVQARRQSR